MLYNTLFSFDDDTGEYLPSIGKSWCYTDYEGNELVDKNGKIDYKQVEEYYSDTSKDYMVVKITLFDNAKWSDGESVTAEDVYYTLDVATDNDYSGHAGALAWTGDLQHSSQKGKLIKQGVFTRNHDDWGTYSYASDGSDTVLYLHVNKVLGAVSTLFTSILILPEHIWKPIVNGNNQLNNKAPNEVFQKEYENPVGCGAWTLVSASRQMIVLKNRGMDYHLKDKNDSTKPLYKVDTIKFMCYLEQNTAIYALLKGYVDLLDMSISSNYVKLFENEENILLNKVTGTSVNTLVMNVNPKDSNITPMRTVLKNKDVRKAIALSIQQEDLVKYVLNDAGKRAGAGLMLENQSALYNPESDILSGDYEERVTQANRILDETENGRYADKDKNGYRLVDGIRMHFEILANPGELELVSYLQQQFQKIGVEVEYKAEGSMAEDTYLFDGNFDMTFQATIFNVSNIDVMYRSHFEQVDSRSSNYGRLMDKTLNETIAQMRTTLNLDLKYELVKKIQILIAENYYKVPVYSSDTISVARTDRFKGYTSGAGETVFNLDMLEVLEKVA